MQGLKEASHNRSKSSTTQVSMSRWRGNKAKKPFFCVEGKKGFSQGTQTHVSPKSNTRSANNSCSEALLDKKQVHSLQSLPPRLEMYTLPSTLVGGLQVHYGQEKETAGFFFF